MNLIRKNDKRLRLLESARELIHTQGFSKTTLADIAQHADVPLGNVYYYYKTKEMLALAVIERFSKNLKYHLQGLNDLDGPMLRLTALLLEVEEEATVIAESGYFLNSLSLEFSREQGVLGEATRALFCQLLSWVEQQFVQLVSSEHAAECAQKYISQLQGAALLTQALADTYVLEKQLCDLKRWIEDLTQ
ncbi:TetR family transcriptional regulator [Piscirickettsia salmonis]|uniref:HTH-type transcriptional repressor NemR n=1 Tax=Piscirickettsia salmonis TaxID=1238 RepID=A0A9Q5V999_PISSA|nr:TetR/AcrR family transcriptional regulator [Piscirickettsia salmonis]ALA24566.1 bacterial regulatory s, tetR family protein [Piscirickettsia salmonis]APS44913.1 TetR family transcriptional regulator [Piscirickettsia salmonis]APS48275.1 TetR family transcriptional regulator [Piscirickettsia salmonis]APS49536.1 TetR family transcriptional regulator [Piscirickettsia salmonis]APS52717.1 TetR family transcriptional regulator [Piscirickettsia salmonis]